MQVLPYAVTFTHSSMEVLDGHASLPDTVCPDTMPIGDENLMDTVSSLKAHFGFAPLEAFTAGDTNGDETQFDPFGSWCAPRLSIVEAEKRNVLLVVAHTLYRSRFQSLIHYHSSLVRHFLN